MAKLKIGIVGCGAIGSSLATYITRNLKLSAELSGLYDLDNLKSESLAKKIGRKKVASKSLKSLVCASNLVIESASAESSFSIASVALKARKDILIMSVGGIAHKIHLLRKIAYRNNCKVYLPSGALSGVDALKASNISRVRSVTLVTTKNPLSFKGVKYIEDRKIKLLNLKKILGENNFNVLKQGKVLNNYSKIKANYELLLGALEVLDYTYDFANHVSDYDLFYQFVIFTLDKLEETCNLYYIAIFKLKLLYLLGIGPVLNRCVLCGSKENLIGFSLNKAGLICKECNDYSLIKLDDFMKTIIVMYYTKLEDLNEEMFDLKYLDKINNLLDQYYEIHLTYKSKANKVIKKIK